MWGGVSTIYEHSLPSVYCISLIYCMYRLSEGERICIRINVIDFICSPGGNIAPFAQGRDWPGLAGWAGAGSGWSPDPGSGLRTELLQSRTRPRESETEIQHQDTVIQNFRHNGKHASPTLWSSLSSALLIMSGYLQSMPVSPLSVTSWW